MLKVVTHNITDKKNIGSVFGKLTLKDVRRFAGVVADVCDAVEDIRARKVPENIEEVEDVEK